jgi:predicted Zn-dependent protease
MVRRDELWVRGTLDESRLSQGQAIARGREIIARDRIDDRELADKLRKDCDAEMDRLRRATTPLKDARVRGIVTVTSSELESTITITMDGVSVVTSPEDVAADYAALKRLLRPPTAPPPARRLPIVWRNGSAAVLLHEAIGHAAEHAHASLDWPRWLRGRDEARDGRVANLIAKESPAALRRESFRDVPLRRMTHLHFEQDGAPFELPANRIEVFLVSGGTYEPLSESISIDVAIADVVTAKKTQRVAPFVLRASRREIAKALVGATGDAIRYPGVICSREGQELYVGSHAPMMLTTELR